MKNQVEFSVCSCVGKHKSKNHTQNRIAPRIAEYERRVGEARKAFAEAKKREDKTIKIKVGDKK